MRAVVQRITHAQVYVNEEVVAVTGAGLLVLLAVGKEDGQEDLEYMVNKLANLRIFADDQGKMNLSVEETGGSILLVSQFTLYGDCRKGNRPNFMASERPIQAKAMYERLGRILSARGIPLTYGAFAEHMQVESTNDGPVTILLDSKREF